MILRARAARRSGVVRWYLPRDAELRSVCSNGDVIEAAFETVSGAPHALRDFLVGDVTRGAERFVQVVECTPPTRGGAVA